MFDAHITDAVFPLSANSSALHRWHNLTFGLPAPAFLLAAGISFGMAVYSRWEYFRGWTPAVKSRLARLAEVLFVAYLLHLPASSLSRTMRASQTEWRKLIGWDILQCIVFTSLLLLAVAVYARRREWFARITGVLLLAVTLASAWVWDIQLTDSTGAAISVGGLAWWITTVLSKQLGSNFPIFPYAAFLLAGALWGCRYVAARERGRVPELLKQTLRWGLILLAACLLLAQLNFPPPYDDFWGGSPVYLILRLCLLTSMLAALYFLEAHLLPALRFLIPFGRESLVVYFVHLIIVYGSPLNQVWNFRRLFRNDAGLLTWVLLYLSLTLAMLALAWVWSRLKHALGAVFDRILWAAAALATVGFVIR